MQNDIKAQVKEKYAEIAVQGDSNNCCGPTGCCGVSTIEITMIGDEYKGIEGHVPDADLGLGCGLPTEHADIKPGDTVLDLGSGAGNDVFVARAITGSEGKVIGVDFTPEMIEKANRNRDKLRYDNVEFRLGDIENMPVEDSTIDVVISNCVLNLIPNKVAAFTEIKRVLKPGGHFCISDVVFEGVLPEGFKRSAEMYAGCVAGALQSDEYLGIIENTGFKDIKVAKTKKIDIPNEVFKKFLTPEEHEEARKNHLGIYSITVTAVN